MKNTMIKAITVLLVVATTASCYGPFRLTNKLHNWNGQVSQKKFVNELVFLAMCIIPAYEVCLLSDGLVLNSIEWWGGRNPVSLKEGETEEIDFMHQGRMYKIVTSKNSMTVALKDSDEKVNFKYFPEENRSYQMDGEVKVMALQE